MKKQGLKVAFALVATMAFLPIQFSAAQDATHVAGNPMLDETVYVGTSPVTSKPLYTTPRDAPGVYAWKTGDYYCRALQAYGHSDWRAPMPSELNLLYENRHKGRLQGTFNETGSGSAGWYWSSSLNFDIAKAQRFSDGIQDYNLIEFPSSLRCVR